MAKASENKKRDEGNAEGEKLDEPRMSEDSQAFIGLKLRELYDDVVAEPVPDRLLDLLNQLGDDDQPLKGVGS